MARKDVSLPCLVPIPPNRAVLPVERYQGVVATMARRRTSLRRRVLEGSHSLRSIP